MSVESANDIPIILNDKWIQIFVYLYNWLNSNDLIVCRLLQNCAVQSDICRRICSQICDADFEFRRKLKNLLHIYSRIHWKSGFR